MPDNAESGWMTMTEAEKEAFLAQTRINEDDEDRFLLKKDKKLSLRMMFYFGAMVVIAICNSVTWKRTLNKFRGHNGQSLEFFVCQWTIFLYIVLTSCVLAYRWNFTRLITAQQRSFPQTKFVFMGLLDALCGLFSAMGGAFVAGQVQTLLNQATIPLTMIMSVVCLAVYYSWVQRFGAVLIVAGAVVATVPTFFLPSADSQTSTMGVAVFALSILPNAFSNVYKEQNLKGEGLDVYYLTVFETSYQLGFGFLAMPLLSLPAFGGVPMSEIPTQFSHGWQCFSGEYVDGYHCHEGVSPALVLLAYVMVNFVYCVLMLVITKHGSAMLVVIASTLSMPLTNVAFSMELVMGDEAEAFSLWNVLGLAVVVVGFLMYSLSYDEDVGEFIPVQAAAAGQMPYITDTQPDVRPYSKSVDYSASRRIPPMRETTYGSF